MSRVPNPVVTVMPPEKPGDPSTVVKAADIPGMPLYLVAREISHAPGYQWKISHPVGLICDSYDANGGRIDTSGAHGVDGKNGKNGKDGVKSPGAAGMAGTDGTPGAGASPITLIASTAVNVSLHANGGNAGHGGDESPPR